MSLEEMSAFFAARVDTYETHMLENIVGAAAFYPETAALLPLKPDIRILDLGCGTGLELDYLYRLCPSARVTGIDLSEEMLAVLRKKPYADKLTLQRGSYFDLPFGEGVFDAALSVESLHHFTKERKLILYTKLKRALRPGGVYVETDYTAADDEEERFYFDEYASLSGDERVPGDFHYDTPLTYDHTRALLLKAGFDRVEKMAAYENTTLIRASLNIA